METNLLLKSLNATFNFLKTLLLPLEQIATSPIGSNERKDTILSIPIKTGTIENRFVFAKQFKSSTTNYFSMALVLLGLFFVDTSTAQGTLGRWQMCGLSGSTGSVNPTGVDANTTFSTLTRGPGLSSSSVSDGYRSSGFSTSNLSTSNNDYYEFTITPNAGYKISLSALKIRDQRSTNSSTFDVNLRFSDDGYASDVVAPWLPSTTLTNRTLDLSGVAALQNRTTAITFRIYGSDSNSTSDTYGFFCQGTNSGNFRGIDVDGTAVALPVSIGRWQMCGLSGSTGSVNPTGVDANITLSTLTRGPGLSSSSVSDGYRSSGFSTSNLSTSNNDYYEFTLTPDAGYKISLSALKIRDQRSTNSSTFDANLRFSDDGYASDVVASWLPSTTLTNRTLDLSGVAALQDRTTAITFRIYGSDSNNTSDTYGFFCQGTNPSDFKGIDFEGNVIALGSSTISVTGSTSFNYNGSNQGPTTSSVTGSTGAVTYSYSGTGATSYSASATRPTNAGTYQVIATLAADSNYNGAVSSPFAFTINKASLTITANNVNKTYGATLTGGSGSTAFTPSGLQNGQTIGTVTIAYGTGAAATAAVATYTGSVTPSAATGGTFSANNYDITYATGNIIVGKANLTITANDVNKTYGATLTGGAGSTAFTSSALQNSETIGSVTIAYGSGAASNAAVGTYSNAVTPSAATGGTFNTNNYNINYATGDIIVNPGAFVKLQLLLPGETAAPGTGSGKTGTPTSRTSGVAFNVTVNAVDAFWNVVPTAPANTIAISSSDGVAILPSNATLSSGTRNFSVTLKTVGSATVTATNVTNGLITANTSPSVTVTPGIKTTNGDGNWSDPNTWSPVGVPYFSDQVYILDADDVTVTANATCASINFTDENSSLSVNSGITLTVTGAVTLNSYNDDTDTSAEILGNGTLNAGSLNVGLASTLNNDDGSDNTLVIGIAVLNVTGDITMYNNDEGGGDANRPGLYINSPSTMSANKLALIQTGNGSGGSRIITFDVDNGATVNLSGGPNPITISSEVDLDFDHVNFALGSSSTINYNGSVIQNIPASISNSRSGGDTDSRVPVNYGNLTINNNTGTTTTDATGRTINVAGNWTNNGVFTATGSTVNFTGNGAQAITGTNTTTFNDVTIAKTGGTLTVNTDATVADDLTFTASSGTLSVSNSKTLNIADNLILNNNANNSVTASITGSGTLLASTVIVGPALNPNNTSTRTTTLNSSVSTFTVSNDLEINSYYNGGNRRNNGVFNLQSGVLTINGEINTTNENSGNTSTFSMASGAESGLLKLTAASPFNLSGQGTNTINLNGTSAVVEYMGSVNQNALGTTYRTLLINNSNTGVTLSGNATAATLDLTDGLLTTGSNVMTIASGGTILNASTTTYVNGKLARVLTNTNDFTYPVGKGGVYSPVVFTYATAPGSRTVTIEQFETGTPFSNSASLATFGSRYWNVTQSATGIAYRVGLNDGGNSGDVPSGASVVILRKDNTTITSNATNYSAPNYTNVSAFAASNASNDVSLGVNNIPLTITGITGINTKIYDGTAIATAIGTPILVGTILPGDTVTLGGTPVYTFDTKHIGTGKPVTVSGFTLGGTNGSGYSLPTNQIAGLSGDITVRPITVTAVSSTKVYDGNTNSSVTPSYALQPGDTAASIPTQSFDTKDFGTNKTLTPTGLVINDGNGGNNYTISYAAANLGTITQKSLTASLTSTVINKFYDGTTNATLTAANYSLSGVVSSEDVIITNTNGTYDNKNFGTGKTVTVTGLVLGGADAANYVLSNPTSINRNVGTISKTTLIASVIGTVSKQYDGNNSATLTSGNYTLSGLVPLEDVTITNTSGTYDNKRAGINKTVTVTGLVMTGADINNYNLFATATGAIGEITQKPITITGATSNDKIYDTTTEATVTGGSLVGVLGADDVLLIQEGTFSTILAGGPYAVTSTCRIAGDDALNYSLVQPILPNASINQKELTLKDVATTDKVYDATNVAILTGGELLGLYPVDGPNVSFIPSGYYADANIGNWTITSTTTLSGSASGNYYLTQPVFAVKKDITPKGLTITGFSANDKVYDGTTTATVNSSGATLSGVIIGQSVTLNSGSVTANFDTKDVGINKTVTIGGFSISGPNASNYAIIQPTATAAITLRPLTITATDQTKCSGSVSTFVGDEFTKDFNVSGDITSVTLTIIGGDGSISGTYPIRPSAATGAGISNYGPITYIDGSLLVKTTPTATIAGTASVCLNDVPAIVTFTGSNGSGTVQYKFYYTINGGAEQFVTSNPGVSTATVSVPTAISRTDVYALTRVEDVNNGCSRVESSTATLTIGACTQVRPLQCGQTLPALDTAFQVSPVSGATQYRFEVTRIDTNTVTYITTPNYYFYPGSQIPGGLVYGKSYSVRVQLFIGTWLAYGSTCTITAPNAPVVTVATTTKIRPFQCGATLSNINTSIEAGPIPGASVYEFEVTPSGGSAIVVSSPNYHFILTNTAGLAAYNKAYSIKVRAFINGGIGWTNWGNACVVTTPSQPLTKLFTDQCGKTFNTLSITLNANNILLATKYRFRVVNGATTRIVETPRNYFIASELAGGYANNTVYTVDVATLYNGVWSAYGPACTVTTPFIRMASQDINTNVFEVKAFPNPFARHFSLDIQSSSDDLVQVRVYDMIGRELEVQNATVSELSIKEIGTNYPSGVYNVVVNQGKEIKTVRMIKR